MNLPELSGKGIAPKSFYGSWSLLILKPEDHDTLKIF